MLHMLNQDQLAHVLLPVGALTKAEVRARAAALGLRTAAKPDSQDVCFISRKGGRHEFLAPRLDLHPGRVVDQAGRPVGSVPAVEMVTVGQRKGLSPTIGHRYVTAVDTATATVQVGSLADLMVNRHPGPPTWSWVKAAAGAHERLQVQMSAHGAPVGGRWEPVGAVQLEEPVRRVAAGQSVVLYRGDSVVGGGVARL